MPVNSCVASCRSWEEGPATQPRPHLHSRYCCPLQLCTPCTCPWRGATCSVCPHPPVNSSSFCAHSGCPPQGTFPTGHSLPWVPEGATHLLPWAPAAAIILSLWGGQCHLLTRKEQGPRLLLVTMSPGPPSALLGPWQTPKFLLGKYQYFTKFLGDLGFFGFFFYLL